MSSMKVAKKSLQRKALKDVRKKSKVYSDPGTTSTLEESGRASFSEESPSDDELGSTCASRASTEVAASLSRMALRVDDLEAKLNEMTQKFTRLMSQNSEIQDANRRIMVAVNESDRTARLSRVTSSAGQRGLPPEVQELRDQVQEHSAIWLRLKEMMTALRSQHSLLLHCILEGNREGLQEARDLSAPDMLDFLFDLPDVEEGEIPEESDFADKRDYVRAIFNVLLASKSATDKSWASQVRTIQCRPQTSTSERKCEEIVTDLPAGRDVSSSAALDPGSGKDTVHWVALPRGMAPPSTPSVLTPQMTPLKGDESASQGVRLEETSATGRGDESSRRSEAQIYPTLPVYSLEPLTYSELLNGGFKSAKMRAIKAYLEGYELCFPHRPLNLATVFAPALQRALVNTTGCKLETLSCEALFTLLTETFGHLLTDESNNVVAPFPHEVVLTLPRLRRGLDVARDRRELDKWLVDLGEAVAMCPPAHLKAPDGDTLAVMRQRALQVLIHWQNHTYTHTEDRSIKSWLSHSVWYLESRLNWGQPGTAKTPAPALYLEMMQVHPEPMEPWREIFRVLRQIYMARHRMLVEMDDMHADSTQPKRVREEKGVAEETPSSKRPKQAPKGRPAHGFACRICGHRGDHYPDACPLADHPLANSTQKLWGQSAVGQRWLKAGYTQIPLVGAPRSWDVLEAGTAKVSPYSPHAGSGSSGPRGKEGSRELPPAKSKGNKDKRNGK